MKEVLLSHFLFSNFTDDMLSLILDDLIEFNLDKENVLFEKGDDGHYFFFLRRGELSVLEEGLQKRIIKEYECFGELSLLNTCKRTFTVKANSDCSLYMLEGTNYREIVKKLSTENMTQILDYIDQITILQSLDKLQKTNIASLIVLEIYKMNQKIINKGDDGDRMYLVKEGAISCLNNGKEIKRLGPTEYFGENSLVFETKRSLDVISVDNTVCYIITRTNLEEALGPSYQSIVLKSFFNYHMTKNKFAMNLCSKVKMDDLYKLFDIKRYRLRGVVFNKDRNENKKLVLIFQGYLVEDRKNKEILAGIRDLYGEDIINKNEKEYYLLILVFLII
jgi:cAMP-dependent protein kinase regulator